MHRNTRLDCGKQYCIFFRAFLFDIINKSPLHRNLPNGLKSNLNRFLSEYQIYKSSHDS